jgi:exopolysaccharide biosynthesis polyprenyl glycosylphosphotransferase
MGKKNVGFSDPLPGDGVGLGDRLWMTATSPRTIVGSATATPILPSVVSNLPETPKRRPRSLGLRATLIIVDAVAVFLGVATAAVADGVLDLSDLAPVAITVLMGLAFIAGAGLYKSRVASVRARELSRMVPVSVAVGVALYASYAVIDARIEPALAVALACATLVLLVAGRSGFDAWLRECRRRGQYCRSVIVVGTGDEAREFAQLVRDHPELGYRVKGLVGPYPTAELEATVRWLGPTGSELEVLRAVGADGVFIAAGSNDLHDRSELIRRLVAEGVHVHLSGGVWGVDHRRLRPLPIGYEPLFYLEQARLRGYRLRVKRVLDLVLAPITLVLFSPILLIAALAIKLQDGGSIFYSQKRVGQGGETFDFLKLRTMVEHADTMQDDLVDLNGRNGPLFKAEHDPRITRFGRFLRASSIDELPQLFNVIRGEMSLVGPRPALPSEVSTFDDELIERHRVLPGITGLWQVEARDNPSFAAYRRLDLFYIENWSLSLDLVILILTVEHVCARVLRKALSRSGDPESLGV